MEIAEGGEESAVAGRQHPRSVAEDGEFYSPTFAVLGDEISIVARPGND